MAQNIVGLEVRKQESGRYIYVLSLDKLNRQLGAIFLTRNVFISFSIIFAQTWYYCQLSFRTETRFNQNNKKNKYKKMQMYPTSN